jgi:magnesium chelatase family protein
VSRISGPLLDRIDIEVELPSLSYDELSQKEPTGECSAVIRERVIRARHFAAARMQGETGIFCNAQLDAAGIHEFCQPDAEAAALLRAAYDRMGLSARGYDRVLRVARTIADLAGSELIGAAHVAEAIQLRSLDRKYWG